MHKFIKDLLSVMLSKAGIILFSLGRAIITARWLGPELNGTITALAVYPALFMTIGSLGVSQATTFYIGKGTFNIESIKRGIAQLWLFSTIFSFIVCFVLIKEFSSAGNNIILILLATLPIPFNLFNTYNSGLFLGQNKISSYNKINWLPAFFIFIFSVLLIIVFKYSIYGALMAAVAGPLFMASYLFLKNDFIKSFSLKIEYKVIKSLASLGVVYAISLLIINLNYKADVVLLDKLSTPYQLGIYSKGVALIEYLWEIPMLFSTIIFARSAVSKDGEAFSKKVGHLLRLSIIAIGSISIILMLLSKFIIQLLFGEAFLPSAQVLTLLLPGVLLLTIFKVLNMDLAGKGKPWVSMKAMVPALILNLVLNFLFIPKYGANGSALSSTISYAMAALLFLYFYAKEVKVRVSDILYYSNSDFDIIKQFIISGKQKIQKSL